MSVIDREQVSGLLSRTLNHVDPRLTDHGVRVAYMLYHMLGISGQYNEQERVRVCLLALLHDIGAYKTEEIDQMVRYESTNIWEHSLYGSLFIRHLSPLSELAPAVLFHHLDYHLLEKLPVTCKREAQLINLADRIDIYLHEEKGDRLSLPALLQAESGKRFCPQCVALFLASEAKEQLSAHLDDDHTALLKQIKPEETQIDAFLQMIIAAIDFRSQHTVTHTLTTTHISKEIALLMELPAAQVHDIYYGAMLHDLGKIGIPVEILEFPGKLSPQAMCIMRTHVEITAMIFAGAVDETIARIALRHHEKLDGSGYPYKLRAQALSLPERIVAAADIMSALGGTRSYKEAYAKEKTLAILQRMGEQGLLDGKVVDVLTDHYDQIMAKVEAACAPALASYRLIHSEYERMLAELTASLTR